MLNAVSAVKRLQSQPKTDSKPTTVPRKKSQLPVKYSVAGVFRESKAFTVPLSFAKSWEQVRRHFEDAGREHGKLTHSHEGAGSAPALDSQLCLWAKQSIPYGAQLSFWGVGWFFYYVHWQFKAGGKHAGNLEAFEWGGAEYFTTAQPNSFPKPERCMREGWKVNGDLLCRESKQRKECPEGYALSLQRDASVPYHTFFSKIN